MTNVSSSDVKKLATMSALSLSDDEAEAMQADLEQILAYVEQLDAVETDGVKPMYQPHDLETVVRPDEIVEYGVSQAELLKNAADKIDGSVVVPRVLE